MAAFGKEFWQLFLRKGAFFLLGLFILALLVAGAGYFWKVSRLPDFIDRYLPAGETLAYIEGNFPSGSVERQGLWQDMKRGTFGVIGQELLSGSGAVLLDQQLGAHMGLAVMLEQTQAIPVYFFEGTFADTSYLSQLGAHTTNQGITTYETGTSFALTEMGGYIVISGSTDVLHKLHTLDSAHSLEHDTTYQHGRSNLAGLSNGRGYVNLALLRTQLFANEQWRGQFRDFYLLFQPILAQLEQVVWNINKEGNSWRIASVMNVNKELMKYFLNDAKMASTDPVWQGRDVTLALDSSHLSPLLSTFDTYLKTATDPLAQILRAYMEESGRTLLGLTDSNTPPAIGYGGAMIHVDPVTFEPSLVVMISFDKKDQAFFQGLEQQGMPLLLSTLDGSAAVESVEMKNYTVEDAQVNVFAGAGPVSLYSSVGENRMWIGLGSQQVFDSFLQKSTEVSSYYPTVRSMSYLVDMQDVYGLAMAERPVTATGSLIYSLDTLSGGLRTFDDGVRFEFGVTTRP